MKRYSLLFLSIFSSHVGDFNYTKSNSILNITYAPYLYHKINGKVSDSDNNMTTGLNYGSFSLGDMISKIDLLSPLCSSLYGGYYSDKVYDNQILQDFTHVLSTFSIYSWTYFLMIENLSNILLYTNFDKHTSGSFLAIFQIPVILIQYAFNVSIHELGHFSAYITSGYYDIPSMGYFPKMVLGSLFSFSGFTKWGTDSLSSFTAIYTSSAGVFANLVVSKYFFLEKMQNLNYLGTAANIGMGVVPVYILMSYYMQDLDHKYIDSTLINKADLNTGSDILSILVQIASLNNWSSSDEKITHEEKLTQIKAVATEYQNHYYLNLLNTKVYYCLYNFANNVLYSKNLKPENYLLFRYMPSVAMYLSPVGAVYSFSFIKFFDKRRSMIDFTFEYVKDYLQENRDDLLEKQVNCIMNIPNIFTFFHWSLFRLDLEGGLSCNQNKIERTKKNKTIMDTDSRHHVWFVRPIMHFFLPLGKGVFINLRLFLELKNVGYVMGSNFDNGFSIYPVIKFIKR